MRGLGLAALLALLAPLVATATGCSDEGPPAPDDDATPPAPGTPGDAVQALAILDDARIDELAGLAFVPAAESPSGRDAVAVCSSNLGAAVVDLGDPTAPSVRASFTALLPRCDRALWLADGRLLLTNRQTTPGSRAQLVALDWDGANGLAHERTTLPPYEPADIARDGDRLLVAAYADGLVVGEVLADGTVEERGRLEGLAGARAVEVGSGGLVAVADGPAGLVLARREGDALALLGALSLPGVAMDVALTADGGRAVVALGAEGLAWVDVSTPTAPVLLSTLPTDGSVVSAAVAEGAPLDRAYVLASQWLDLALVGTANDTLALLAREPILRANDRENGLPTLPSRSAFVLARGALGLSATWHELTTLRLLPGFEAGDLRLDPSSQHLREDPDGPPSALVTLENEGTRALALAGATATSPGWTIEAPPDSLGPGARTSLRVTFAGQGPPATFLEVASDDPDEPIVRAQVSAPGQGATVGDPAPAVTLLDLDGDPETLALGPGPVLLSYFATF